MRRWISVLLLVLLPFHFGSAAGAVHCQHATDNAQHFGHHDHAHKAHDGHADPGAPADSKTSASIDTDCGTCHAGCCTAVLSETRMPAFAHTSALADTYQYHLNTVSHSPPERPNWPSLA